MKLDLTVAIVSFNSGKLITTGLREVITTDMFPVLVVDNYSTDNSLALLKQLAPQLEFINLDNNLGYGRAANIAIKHANTRYLLLLNPDIRVADKAIASFFQSVLEHDANAVIYAPATNNLEHTKTGWHEVNNVLGAVMLFDLKLLKPIGIFDENLFLYYEEKDLCKRVRQAGGSILRLSDVIFEHAKGTSSGSSDQVTYLKQWHVAWSSAYYLKKHRMNRGRHRLDVMLLRYLFKYFFSFSLHKRLKYRARVGGLIAYLLGRQAFDEHGIPRRLEVLDRPN